MDTKDQSTELFKGHEEIQGLNIGYCRYGVGPNYVLTICGAVGCYEKDWPLDTLRHYDPQLFTIVSIDPPGYGTSRPPDRKQEILRCSKDAGFCNELMKKLNLIPFTVVGWSEGARTAIHVAFRGKEKVERMVLMAATTRVDARGTTIYKGLRNTDQWMAADRKGYLNHYSNDFLKKQWAENCDMVQECYDMLGGRFPCDSVLGKINCPSLILNGGQDRFCGDPKYIQGLLKNSKLEVQLHGNHDFHLKYSKWVAEKISGFIKETCRKQA